MNLNNFTIKAQEAVQQAAQVAAQGGQQAIETGHLMKGLLLSDENVTGFLTKKVGANAALLGQRLDAVLAGYPKISGGARKPS